MGYLKVVTMALLALTLCLLFWPAGRAHLRRLLRTVLWASCAITASTAAIILGDARESLLALVGGLLLLGFCAYAACTAKALGRK